MAASALPPPPDLRRVRHLAIIKPSSLGDIIHTLPAAGLLKARWPHLKLSWIVNTEWAPLLAGSPLIDEVICFPRREFRGLGGAVRSLAWFRGLGSPERPVTEVALDFQGLLRSALMTRALAPGLALGLSDAREGARHFYDQVVPVNPGAHAVDRYLALVAALGVTPQGPEEVLADHLPPGDPLPGELPDRFVVIHPYARGKGKSITQAEIHVLARALAPFPTVLAGVAPQRLELAADLDHVLDMTNQTTLGQLIFLLRRSAAVISVDSGPMHIASALRKPLTGLHTWSDPRCVGPYDPAAWVWKGGQILHRSQVGDSLAARTVRPTTLDLEAVAARTLASIAG